MESQECTPYETSSSLAIIISVLVDTRWVIYTTDFLEKYKSCEMLMGHLSDLMGWS